MPFVISHTAYKTGIKKDMSHCEAIEEKVTMIGLEDIRKDWELKNLIDWDMTPEEAVTLYLESGETTGLMVRILSSRKKMCPIILW